MTIRFQSDEVVLHHGDCLDVLASLPDASVDSVVTDPPYGLGFAGKEKSEGKSFVERKAAKRNTFDHVGGNHNPVNSADQQKTRLRENRAFGAWCESWAAEAHRVLKPGGHMLAFGGTRTWHRLAVAVEDAGFEIRDSVAWLYGSGMPKTANLLLKPAFEPIVFARKPLEGTVASNLIAHGTGTLDVDGVRVGGRFPANVILDESQADSLDSRLDDLSRFFYTAKADSTERPVVDGIAHPTVKPLDLMRWLIRLVTPRGGVALDPFAGSGTTLEAAVLEGFRAIGIEREAAYLPLIEQRLDKPHTVGLDLFGDVA